MAHSKHWPVTLRYILVHTVYPSAHLSPGPPAAERPGPHYQKTPTPGDARAIIPNCSCPWRSDAQPRPPPTSYDTEPRDPRHYEVSKARFGTAPYT